jgi:uncharacterized protein (DUF2236 family)
MSSSQSAQPTEPDPAQPVLGALDPSALLAFGPQSTIRLVVGEPIVNLLYLRALIMEVAHPSVGAAVADHSRFQERPIHRLGATSDAALRLIFGQRDEPMGAARQIYRFHDHINGATAGGRYTAHDASLLLWVWATLVDNCDLAFCRWVRPYRPGEREAFYGDMCAFARFFGIPAALIPPDRPAFAAYLDGMLDGDILGSTATSGRVVRDVLWFRRWFLPPPAMSALRVLAIGTLDPRLAERLGLHLTPTEGRRFDRLDEFLRRHYRRLPPGRVNLPYRYLALRRFLVRMDRPGRFPALGRRSHACRRPFQFRPWPRTTWAAAASDE